MKMRQISSAPIASSPMISGSSTPASFQSLEGVPDEVARLSEEKSKVLKGGDEAKWREQIRRQMEDELNARVREALETPPLERAERQRLQQQQQQHKGNLEQLNSHLLFDLNDKSHEYLKARKWRALEAKRQMQKLVRMNYAVPASTGNNNIDVIFRDQLSKSNQDEFPGVFGLHNFSEGIKERNSLDKYPSLKQIHRQFYTKDGFLAALDSGKFPDGTVLELENGCYRDRFGVIRDQHGPFWPGEWGPLFPTPRFLWFFNIPPEPLFFHIHNQQVSKTFENQVTPYSSKWRGVLIVYDSERSSRDRSPQPVPEGCCPNLVFESRFESGNLRQARRVGQFEYELVLKTDLYTNRHTQWYYFRVQNVVPGVVYKFRIVNLLKRDSLYNYGMRPLLYSEKDAKSKSIGWIRAGHHISYSRNVMHLHCPLLMRGIAYYELEWQMEFDNENDTYYLAHCYPYTFTDLKEDLDSMLNNKESRQWLKREVLCETRAGNSCFLVTVTNFDTSKEEQMQKKVVVVTARVHPGESQASWMMKGLLEYITCSDPVAKELRNRFIFKVVPMLNPDGVIVGNYRCSLAGRDLNRNYRHPRKESFPTVWFTKHMMEKILERHDILLYCDLHGHSRKHNVFMYGNNTSEAESEMEGIGAAQAFLNERLFPWLMSQKSPEKFSFPSCKFQIKRCKEATGRVVMWRQLRVLNSFTLEATFSGTTLDKKDLRHFNVSDYMDMGKVLSQTVLEYQLAQENKAKQTDIVLELTKFVTNQIIEQRRVMNSKGAQNLKNISKTDKIQQVTDVCMESGKDSYGGLPSCAEMENNDLDDAIFSYMENDKSMDDGKREKKMKKHESKHQSNLSRKDVDNILDNASLKTMDGCLKILTQLNVREALQESDSSDSDSESEAELKPMDSKSKKKKRKSKKQRDKEHQERKGGSGGSDKKGEGERSKSLTLPRERNYKDTPAIINTHAFQAIPTLPTCSDAQHDPGIGNSNNSNNKKTSANLERYMKQSKDSRFVSKYEGRRNGGIPCFAEERSIERAAKRMADMKKRSEDEKNREMAFFSYERMMDFLDHPRAPTIDLNRHWSNKCAVEDTLCSGPSQVMSMQLRRSLTNDELQRRLQVALNEGTPNIAQTLVGLNVKTGYTHAGTREWIDNTTFNTSFSSITETFRDMTPTILPPAMPPVRDIRFGTFDDKFITASPEKPDEVQIWKSSEDGSDSDVTTSAAITLAARTNPYNQDNVSSGGRHLTGIGSNSMLQKNHKRSGPVLKSVQRHMANSSPSGSFLPNGIVPLSTEETPKLEKRSRISRTPGPLTIYGEETMPKLRGAIKTRVDS